MADVTCVARPLMTFDDFLALTDQSEWPVHLTSESLPELPDDLKELTSSVEDVRKLFGTTTLVTDAALSQISQQIQEFECQLLSVADHLLNVRLDGTGNVSQVSEHGQCHSIKHSSRPLSYTSTDIEHDEDNKSVVQQLLQLQSRAVEHFKFPGFCRRRLTALPGNVEALGVLYDVLMTQPILENLKVLWKKIFLSEASVAMLHDAFWWTYIDTFQRDLVIERSRLFDRLADTFVALLYSITPDIKDKVLMTYSDCLAQSVYAVYSRAFPASVHNFNDEFKQYLTNTCYEWIGGIQPPAGRWITWNLSTLERRVLASDSNVAKLSAVAHGNTIPPLDLSGLRSSIQSLGTEDDAGTEQTEIPGVSTARSQSAAITVTSNETALSLSGYDPIKRLWGNNPSHPVGRGSELERFVFNMNGRSVLASHFMRQRQLHSVTDGNYKTILRTQVTKLPAADALTYRDVVQSTWTKHQQRNHKYQLRLDSVAARHSQQVSTVDQQQNEAIDRIDKLQSQLKNNNNNNNNAALLSIDVLSDSD